MEGYNKGWKESHITNVFETHHRAITMQAIKSH